MEGYEFQGHLGHWGTLIRILQRATSLSPFPVNEAHVLKCALQMGDRKWLRVLSWKVPELFPFSTFLFDLSRQSDSRVPCPFSFTPNSLQAPRCPPVFLMSKSRDTVLSTVVGKISACLTVPEGRPG